jgi:DNA topoisomerase-1
VKYGAKSVSLKTDDPYEITLERALEVIREKEIADANRLILDFPDAGIQVLNGRYGPYITDKERNAKIPKDREPKSLTLVECQAMLAAAPLRTFGKWGRKNGKQTGKSKSANGAAAKTKPANGAAKVPAAPATPVPAAVRTAGTARLAAKGAKTAADKKAPVKAAPARPSAKKSGPKPSSVQKKKA